MTGHAPPVTAQIPDSPIAGCRAGNLSFVAGSSTSATSFVGGLWNWVGTIDVKFDCGTGDGDCRVCAKTIIQEGPNWTDVAGTGTLVISPMQKCGSNANVLVLSLTTTGLPNATRNYRAHILLSPVENDACNEAKAVPGDIYFSTTQMP